MIIYDIDDTKKDELKSCLPDVLQYYASSPIRYRDRKYFICCPVHSEKTPSCEVNPTKGVFYCFGCGVGGDVFSFVAEREGVKLNDPDKVKALENFHKVAKIIADIGGVYLKEKSNIDGNQEQATPTPDPKPKPQPIEPNAPKIEPYFIPFSMIQKGEERIKETGFYNWLCREFGSDPSDTALRLYHVGASKYIAEGCRAVSFPYIDSEGNCIDCKIFHIDGTTGSRKTAPPVISFHDKAGKLIELKDTWALASIGKKNHRAEWCNFGDHLLSRFPHAPICIVEAEKTALCLSIIYPERLWVAVGGKNNLKLDRVKHYKGKKIIVCPDRDGVELWSQKAREFAQQGFDISIDKTIIENPGSAHDDLLDVLLRYRHGQQQAVEDSKPHAQAVEMWEGFKAENPFLAELESFFDFDLETISLTTINPN